MDAGQVLWLIIDIVMGLAILGAFVVALIIAIIGRSGSTSKRPKKRKATKIVTIL